MSEPLHVPNEGSAFTFAQATGPVLIITHDGRFILGPGATVDEAAQAVVDAATRLWQEQRTNEGEEWKR